MPLARTEDDSQIDRSIHRLVDRGRKKVRQARGEPDIHKYRPLWGELVQRGDIGSCRGDIDDVTFREDRHQARTGTGPAVIATLRNTAIIWHRTTGATNIARATRRSHDLITAMTSTYPRTQ